MGADAVHLAVVRGARVSGVVIAVLLGDAPGVGTRLTASLSLLRPLPRT
jgi:hypothetical protein